MSRLDWFLDTTHLRTPFEMLRDSMRHLDLVNGSLLAAGLAFFTLLSIAPLLLVAIAVAGVVLGEASTQQLVIDQIRTELGVGVAELLGSMIDEARAHSSTSGLIGTGIALYTASRVNLKIREALNAIWEVRPDEGGTTKQKIARLLRVYGAAFLMVFILGLLLLTSVLLQLLTAGLHQVIDELIPLPGMGWQLLEFGVSLTLLTCSFALAFRTLSDAAVARRSLWWGAMLTAVMFVIGSLGLSYYLTNFAGSSMVGAAGAAILLLMWLQYSAFVVFLGASLIRTRTHRRGELVPAKKGAHTTSTTLAAASS